MNRIDRLLGMLTLLQSKKNMTAEAIAEKFGISVRTVYRDIKALCEQGIPIGFEPHKGYGVVQGFFLPPVSFTTEEANALLLIEAMVTAFADKSIQTHYSTALDKVKAVLRHSQKEKLEALDESIKINIPDTFHNSYEYLSLIQHAISEKHILDMEYKNLGDTTSRRQAEPIGLVFYSMNWHLIAWCHLRQEYRDFRVSRILKLRDTGQPYKITNHMELGAFIQKATAGF